MVREGGIEPPRPFGHKILNLARLPIPPPAHEPGSLPKRAKPNQLATPARESVDQLFIRLLACAAMPTGSPIETISPGHSSSFAALSGDWNPIHCDQAFARKTLFGATVLHGIHIAMHMLECGVRGLSPIELTRFEVEFPHPCRHGESFAVDVLERTDAGLKAIALSGGKCVGELKCGWLDRKSEGSNSLPNALIPRSEATEVDRTSAKGLSGSVPLMLNRSTCQDLFPQLSRNLPAEQLALILAATRIVGMKCPGLHSIFLKLGLEFDPSEDLSPALNYRVELAHAVTGFTRIRLDAGYATGTIIAAFRPESPSQPTCEAISDLVPQDTFRSQRALVVGGSRGLGETAAKLLAVGGADVLLTYRTGRSDAERVVAEICDHGGRARAIAYDASGSTPIEFEAWEPTHLYYFATPPIVLDESNSFEQPLFESYCKVYVDGFWRLLATATHYFKRPIIALYPSSAALDEILPGAAEYAAAKSAGETLCRHLEKAHDKVRIHVHRFPRMLTDQTASVMPYDYPDNAALLLEVLRMMPNPKPQEIPS